MRAAAQRAYGVMNDDFDFIFFVVNNATLPSGMPYGSTLPVKNVVAGLGMSTSLDDTAAYGSSGRLQAAVTLWKNSLDTGPILHEMGHRWFNFGVPSSNGSHWPDYGLDSPAGAGTLGIFAGAGNNYADLELYLMGLIPGSAVADGSKPLYDQLVAAQGPRSPAWPNAQTSFRGLVIVITAVDLDATAQASMDGAVDWVQTRQSRSSGVNFTRQSLGLATLTLDGLGGSLR